jgi:hypothetical protein
LGLLVGGCGHRRQLHGAIYGGIWWRANTSAHNQNAVGCICGTDGKRMIDTNTLDAAECIANVEAHLERQYYNRP